MRHIGLLSLRHLWHAHRTGWLLILGWLVALCLVYQLAPSRAMTNWVGPFAVLPFVFAFLYLLAVMGYGWEADLVSGKSCFPPRLFLLPVSGFDLAFWPMLWGQLSIAFLWGTIHVFVVQRSGIGWTWWQAPLHWMTVLAWFQALLWTSFRFKGARLASLISVIVAMMVFLGVSSQHRWSESTIGLTLGGALLTAYGLAYRSVVRARSDLKPEGWMFGGIRSWWPGGAESRAEFNSATDAQRWLDWRLSWRDLLSTSAMILVVVPVLSMMEHLARDLNRADFWPGVPGVSQRSMATLSLLALLLTSAPIYALASLQMSGCFPSTKLLPEMSPFFAVRPMSNHQFVASKYRMGTLAALLSWGVGVGTLAAWVILTGRLSAFTELQSAMGYTGVQLVGLVVGWVLAILALTWACRLWALFINLSGRRWLVGLVLTVGFLGAIGLLFLVNSSHRAENLPWWQSWLEIISWVVAGMLVLKLVAFLVSVRLSETRSLIRVGLGWLILWAAFWLWGVAYFFDSTAARLTWGMFVALVLPMSRILLGPAMLAWNRHR